MEEYYTSDAQPGAIVSLPPGPIYLDTVWLLQPGRGCAIDMEQVEAKNVEIIGQPLTMKNHQAPNDTLHYMN